MIEYVLTPSLIQAQIEARLRVEAERVDIGTDGGMPNERLKAAPLTVNELLEIKGIVYRVRKLTTRDVVLRRFAGTLVIPKADATATMLARAKAG